MNPMNATYEHLNTSTANKIQELKLFNGQGYKLEYTDTGMGMPIVFLHGALSNINTWRKILPSLSKHFRCIAINLPFGAHNMPMAESVDLSPVGISNLITEFLDHLQLTSVTIVANDTGGAYAQVFTSLHPERVDRLVLSNCEGLGVFPPAKFAYLKYAVRLPGFTYLMSRVFSFERVLKSDLMLGLLSTKLSNEEIHDLYVSNFIRSAGVRRDFTRLAQHWSPGHTLAAADRLRNYDKPVLILWGDKDTKLFPMALGKQLVTIFRCAQLVPIQNSRTYIQEDQPAQMIVEIIRFMKSL